MYSSKSHIATLNQPQVVIFPWLGKLDLRKLHVLTRSSARHYLYILDHNGSSRHCYGHYDTISALHCGCAIHD